MGKNALLEKIRQGASDTGTYNWLNFPGDLFTGGAVTQAEQNDWTRRFNEEQFSYQKWLNQTTMEREDSSIQRRVEDLKKAGLHPVLATGQGASATSLSSGQSVPNLDSGFKNKLSVADILSIMTSTSQINRTNAEAEYVNTLAENSKKKTEAEIKALGIDTDIKEYDFQKAKDNGLFYSKSGMVYEFANALDLLQNKNAFGTLQGIIESQGIDKIVNNVADVMSSPITIPNPVEKVKEKVKEKVSDTVSAIKDSNKIHSTILDSRVDKLWNKLEKKGRMNLIDFTEARLLLMRYEVDKIPVPQKLKTILNIWEKATKKKK